MPRPAGSRNRDYDATRRALAAALGSELLRSDGDPATFKDLAGAAGVSAPTLRHYFGDRDGVIRAVLEVAHENGRPYLAELANPGAGEASEIIAGSLVNMADAWRRYGLGRLVASGLALGLEHRERGPAVLDCILEPILASTERMLAALTARGDLPPHDEREVALALISPVLLALLHQDSLGGRTRRPLDVESLAARQTRLVLAGLRCIEAGR